MKHFKVGIVVFGTFLAMGVGAPPSPLTTKEKKEYIQVVDAKLDNWDKIVRALKKEAELSPSDTRKERVNGVAHALEVGSRRTGRLVRDLKFAKVEDWNQGERAVEGSLKEMMERYEQVMAR